jgi:hypothetical protein
MPPHQIPLMTTEEINALVPTVGMMVYDTNLNTPLFYNGTRWLTFGLGFDLTYHQ